MKTLTKAILVTASAFFLTATTASAEIACNAEGDCWHVKRHDYHPSLNLSIHPDNWKWAEHESDKYRWREHEGHGYWHGGAWIDIR